MQFFGQYLLARAHAKTIEKLLPIVEKSFEHSWVAEVELRIRFWPGNEDRLTRLGSMSATARSCLVVSVGSLLMD
jgi:hypothetical protein